jgi:hypothetical protein
MKKKTRCIIIFFNLMIVLLFIYKNTFSQLPEKINVCVYDIILSEDISKHEIKFDIKNKLIEAIDNYAKLNLINFSNSAAFSSNNSIFSEAITDERGNLFSSGISPDYINSAKKMNVRYLFEVYVKNIEFKSENVDRKRYNSVSKQMEYYKTETLYSCSIKYDFYIIDLSKSKLMLSEEITDNVNVYTGLLGDKNGPTSSEAAYNDALRYSKFSFEKCIKKIIPYEYKILEVFISSEYINKLKLGGDYTNHLYKKKELYVTVVDGFRRKTIAEIKITDINNDGSFIAKIKKGEKEFTDLYGTNIIFEIAEYPELEWYSR